MSNTAKGFEKHWNKKLIQFLSIAKGSACEVKAQLYVALDAGYISQDDFNYIYIIANETGRQIGGFMKYLKSSDFRGLKF